MKKNIKKIIFSLSCMLAALSHAAELEQQLARCSVLADASARLGCCDALAKATADAPVPAAAVDSRAAPASPPALAAAGKASEPSESPISYTVQSWELDPGSKRGVFAHISDDDVEDWQSSIDIVLRRFAEYHDLQGAFGRRALIERAKGILMERHSIDETRAFDMLRQRSRIDNRKLIDLAAAVVDGHRLLPKHPDASDKG